MPVPRIEQPGLKAAPDESPIAGGSLAIRYGGLDAAIPILVLTTALFTWWAWKQGAYFGPVFYPGLIGLAGLMVILLVTAPLRARFTGWTLISVGALLALAAWTALSTVWTDVPAAPIVYSGRIFAYAALFVAGTWVTNLLGRDMVLALAPLAIAGALVGVATTIVIAGGSDVTWYLHPDGSLRFPIGYRNANAAFLMICFWPLLTLATQNRWHWSIRSTCVAFATVLVELAILSQSRGSLPAVLLALIVFVVVSPYRLRSATLVLLAVIPAAIALPTLLDVYRHGAANETSIPLLRDSARMIGITGVASLALSAVGLGIIYPRLRLGARGVQSLTRVLGVLVAVVSIVAVGSFIVEKGGPIKFLDQRVTEFSAVGYPDLHGQGARFGTNVGSNRHDFWRVSLDEGLDHPLLGGGAGSFQPTYLADRKSDETPQDPHSVEMLLFSELGLPGVALFLIFIAGATVAVARSRSLGASAAVLSTASLAVGVQWLVPASYDWFWQYPGVTGAAIYALGAAAAPRLLDFRARSSRSWRALAAAIAVVVGLVSVPLYLSGLYLNRGFDNSRSDPRGAVDDLSRSADLSPLDPEPLLSKSQVLMRLGDEEQSIAAIREALDREPDSFAGHYLLARQLAPTDRTLALAELETARRLNPSSREVRALARRLR